MDNFEEVFNKHRKLKDNVKEIIKQKSIDFEKYVEGYREKIEFLESKKKFLYVELNGKKYLSYTGPILKVENSQMPFIWVVGGTPGFLQAKKYKIGEKNIKHSEETLALKRFIEISLYDSSFDDVKNNFDSSMKSMEKEIELYEKIIEQDKDFKFEE